MGDGWLLHIIHLYMLRERFYFETCIKYTQHRKILVEIREE